MLLDLISHREDTEEGIPWSMPGYFFRPRDRSSITGTDEALCEEHDDETHAIGYRNETAWKRLIQWLGRKLLPGEIVITTEDGTRRCAIKLNPDGTIVLEPGSGMYIKVGDGAVKHMVLWEDLAAYNDGHTHSSPAGGNTGPPNALMLPTGVARSAKGLLE
jgi:hypothetical protein